MEKVKKYSNVYLHIFFSFQGQKEIQRVSFYTFHPNEPLSKERIEAFSDGVFAIVATLLILDIW